jgi:hypothetical protein
MRKAFLLIAGLSLPIIPASAQISPDAALRICRNEVRLDASERLGLSDIRFRSMNLNERKVARNRIEGTFSARRGEETEMHTFVCSVDLAAANLRSLLIDSRSALNSSTASADRADDEVNSSADSPATAADTDVEVMDTCRNVVAGRVRDHGYVAVEFDSIEIDGTQGRRGRVTGRATGETGGHQNKFRFSCDVDRTSGVVRSLVVDGH